MPYPELTIGPMDPDSSSELTKKLGTHNKVDKLIQRHAANYPIELTKALSRPRDEDRSESVDLEEAAAYARALRGRKAFLGDDDEVVAAAVLGRNENERVVALLYRTAKSGRTARGVIPYAELPQSQAAYERLLAERDAEDASGAAPAPITVPEDSGADERVAEAERARVAAEQEAQELRERVAALEAPEPYEGYDDEAANEVVARIREGGRDEFGTVGLQRLVDYEKAHKRRTTVVHAAEDAISAP
jgi:hypothetical protein